MNYSCRREINSITGLLSVYLNWNYEYSAAVEDVIQEKKLFLQLLAGNAFQGGNIVLNPQVKTLFKNTPEIRVPHILFPQMQFFF